MRLTAELLNEKIALLREQQDRHFAHYNQAIGAIGLAEHLRDILSEPEEKAETDGA